MVYKEKNRGFQVGKIYAVRNEQTIYHNDGTKTIIGEGTPVKVTKIENNLITVITAYEDTFTFKQGFSPLWDKILNKSILSPLSTLKQLLINLSYKTKGIFAWIFATLAGLCVLPLAIELTSQVYPFKPTSLLFLISAFIMMFPVHICTEYLDCVDEENRYSY